MNFQNLIEQIKDCDWFCGSGKDDYNRHVIYVNKMNLEILLSLPNECDNVQVLCHYYNSFVIDSSKYVEKIDSEPQNYVVEDSIESKFQKDEIKYHVGLLLEKYGVNTVQDIFYEIHDGGNAVTNLSAIFPELKEKMMDLYRKFGFNPLYKEIEQ